MASLLLVMSLSTSSVAPMSFMRICICSRSVSFSWSRSSTWRMARSDSSAKSSGTDVCVRSTVMSLRVKRSRSPSSTRANLYSSLLMSTCCGMALQKSLRPHSTRSSCDTRLLTSSSSVVERLSSSSSASCSYCCTTCLQSMPDCCWPEMLRATMALIKRPTISRCSSDRYSRQRKRRSSASISWWQISSCVGESTCSDWRCVSKNDVRNVNACWNKKR